MTVIVVRSMLIVMPVTVTRAPGGYIDGSLGRIKASMI
jgi:hypothetical protein